MQGAWIDMGSTFVGFIVNDTRPEERQSLVEARDKEVHWPYATPRNPWVASRVVNVMRQPRDPSTCGSSRPRARGSVGPAIALALAALACGRDARSEPPPVREPGGDRAATSRADRDAARLDRAARATATATTSPRTGTVRAVHVVSRVGASGVADATPKRARVDQGVTLFALIEVTEVTARGKTTRWYSDAGKVRWGTKTLTTLPLAEAPIEALAWRRVEPTVASMSNEASGAFRFERVPYDATVIDGAHGGTLAADVRPTLTPDHGDGVGTMRYQLVVTAGGRTVASPGVESVRGRGSGGLTDDVHRVSLRHDDSYLGMMEEMYGQPYIWASAGSTDRTHQSERLEGSDCADLMVYGARRLGLDVPYGYTGSLPGRTRTLAKGALAADGVYRDARGQALPFTGVGDLVLFPRHVGALAEDHGVPGVLDQDDVMVHTLFDSPKRQRIAESGYADNPVLVLRWPRRR